MSILSRSLSSRTPAFLRMRRSSVMSSFCSTIPRVGTYTVRLKPVPGRPGMRPVADRGQLRKGRRDSYDRERNRMTMVQDLAEFVVSRSIDDLSAAARDALKLRVLDAV